MITKGSIVTTKQQKDYPYMIEVLEIYPCGTKAMCLCIDSDGASRHDYEMKELRPLSAKELAMDVFEYYHIKEPYYMPFHSKKHIEWLLKEAKECDALRKAIREKCEKGSIDIADLDSSELWDFDRAAEIRGWLIAIAELVIAEVSEMKEANPDIEVPVPEWHGKLVATPSRNPDYPGIDLEFVPDSDRGYLSNPRVLMEVHDRNMHAHLWNDTQNKDYTAKVTFLRKVIG